MHTLRIEKKLVNSIITMVGAWVLSFNNRQARENSVITKPFAGLAGMYYDLKP